MAIKKFLEGQQIMSDMINLLSRLDSISEGKVTPVKFPKTGLNQQQKSVGQMPALFKPKSISVLDNTKDPEHPAKKYFVGGESYAAEDILSTVKRKLGDFLQDVEQELKADPALQNHVDHQVNKLTSDHLLPVVKTIKTHLGDEIKIHGNDDDGFRISVKDKLHSARFKNINQAEIACEMYCAHCRERDTPPPAVKQQPAKQQPTQQMADPDYLEER